MKTVLYVHHSGNFGGAPKSLGYLLGQIDLEKYNAILINITEGPVNDFFRTLPVDLRIVKGIRPFHGSTVVETSLKLTLRNWIFLIPSVVLAYKHLAKIKPDIIHLNSSCLFAFAIAAKLWNKKVPVVSHVREPIRKGIDGWPLRFFTKRYVDGLIAISKYDLDSVKIDKEEMKSEVIYNFVDLTEFSSGKPSGELRSRLGIGLGDTVFLYVARFAKSNGWQELIEMAIKLREERHDFHFVLLGAHNKEELNFVSTSGIHILPFQRDVISVMREADVFVCPFTEAHFARGIIEASAVGLPILATNVGGVNELVVNAQTGYLYENYTEFRKAAIKLSDIKLRATMGQQGRKFAEENFSLVTNADKSFGFYEKLL